MTREARVGLVVLASVLVFVLGLVIIGSRTLLFSEANGDPGAVQPGSRA